MPESVDVFKEKILEELERLLEANPPKSPEGKVYLNHLKNAVLLNDSITASEIVEKLSRAGYGIEDILTFFFNIGIITNQDDWIKFRDAIRKLILSGGAG